MILPFRRRHGINMGRYLEYSFCDTLSFIFVLLRIIVRGREP